MSLVKPGGIMSNRRTLSVRPERTLSLRISNVGSVKAVDCEGCAVSVWMAEGKNPVQPQSISKSYFVVLRSLGRVCSAPRLSLGVHLKQLTRLCKRLRTEIQE